MIKLLLILLIFIQIIQIIYTGENEAGTSTNDKRKLDEYLKKNPSNSNEFNQELIPNHYGWLQEGMFVSIGNVLSHFKNLFNTWKEKTEIAVAIDLNEIALEILKIEKSYLIVKKNDEIKNDEKWQLKKCQEMGTIIVWSILWELELLKIENASNSLEEENKRISENYNQVKENIARFYSVIRKVETFNNCQNVLNGFLSTLENGVNDFEQYQLVGISHIELGNWQQINMKIFIKNFLAKYKFDLELIKEFDELKFNKILMKTNSVKQEEEISISIVEMHQLIVKLNGLYDITKIGEIATLLTKNAKKLDKKFNEWIKCQTKKKVDRNDSSWEYREKKIGEIIKSAMLKSENFERYIKKWEKETEKFMKEYYEKCIYKELLKITNLINLVRWNETRIMPERTDEVEVAHTEIQQLILKLISLRRFLLSKNNEAKMNKKQKQIYDGGQNHSFNQKLKWILRRKQRIEDKMQEEQREIFQSKMEKIFAKIHDESEKFEEINNQMKPIFGRLLLKKPLRQFYYGIEERKKLKIRRFNLHTYVTLGNEYEYDYLENPNPSRRTIFKKWKDAELEENDDRKAQPIKGVPPKFSVAEADAIFFEMPSKGWTPSNYAPEKMRKCLSYVYEFVCNLNGGKCPVKEQWPEPFKYIDNRAATNVLRRDYGSPSYTNISVFSTNYANTYHRQFNKKIENDKECAIKELEIQIRMVKDEKWDDKIQKHEKKMEDGAEKAKRNTHMFFPAIVHYDTGRFDDFHFDTDLQPNCPFKFKEPLEIQEYLIKETETSDAILYSALLKVNVCIVDSVPRAFVNNLRLWDSELNNMVYAFGGVNLYEEDDRGHHLFTFEFGENKQLDSAELCSYY